MDLDSSSHYIKKNLPEYSTNILLLCSTDNSHTGCGLTQGRENAEIIPLTVFLIDIQNVHLKATSNNADINKLNSKPLKGMD